MMVYRNESSYPEFVRLLKRNWGADTASLREDTVTPGELLKAVNSQSEMVQQLVEELASFMGKSQDFSISVPMSIVLDGSRQGDTIDGVPDNQCGDGYTSLLVNNIGSTYDEETGTVSNGHAAIFKGVVAFDTVCMSKLILPGNPDLVHASAISFQLPASGWGRGCTVLDYYNGEDPDPDSSGVIVYDPNILFQRFLSLAKGKAVWNPDGGPTGLAQPVFDSSPHWVAVECQESDPPATGEGYIAGCGIDITAFVISSNRAQLITTGGIGPIVPGFGECDLDINTGCGLDVVNGELLVDSQQLTGPGLKLTTSTDCQIEISHSCGLEFRTLDNSLKVKASDLAGQGLTTDSWSECSLAVQIGCGLTWAGNAIAFNPVEVAGNGLTANTAGGYCKLDVVPGALGTATHIMFSLSSDLSSGTPGSAPAVVESFWDGNDPGLTTVVYDYHRDGSGYGPFVQAKGPRGGVRDGAVGMATWDNTVKQYKIVTCQTLANRILFRLTGDMGGSRQAPCTVTDYYDGQNPGGTMSFIFDEADLFEKALTGATGYAVLDDKVQGAAGYDGKYLIIECDQMASDFYGETVGTYSCPESTVQSYVDVKLQQVMSKSPHGQAPPTDQYGNIPCRNMFDRFIPSSGKACHCRWNNALGVWDLVEVKNTKAVTVTGELTINSGTKTISWDLITLCVPLTSVSSTSYTGTDCTTAAILALGYTHASEQPESEQPESEQPKSEQTERVADESVHGPTIQHDAL